MKYEKVWKKVLNPDEKVEYEFSISERYRKFMMVFLIIIIIPLLFLDSSTRIVFVFAVLAVLFYFGFYVKIANAYAFTNKRVLIYQGWIATGIVSIDYAKITDITAEEPFFEIIVTKSGTLSINTAGSPQPEVVLKHIDAPYEIKKKLDLLKDKT
ncbi:PH domain-containing protein [Patescibacteria group bacterium]|nr:PH domain-containing protein [Patescibacteria group bacterium]